MPDLASGKLILDEPGEGVVRLRIANPDRRGALDHEILDTLAETVRELGARCLVLTGTGPMFSAGYDLANLEGQGFEDQAERLVAHPFHAAIQALEAYPYPTVAVLNGHAIGGGLEVAVSCDLRVAARGVELAMPPAKLGLVYSHTGLRRFIEAIGGPRTREMFLVGRRVEAQTAERWGLVNRVFEPEVLEAETLALAMEIAGNAPLSLQGNKRVIAELLKADHVLDPQVEHELTELRRACFESDDFREGVRAFAERRAPYWQGR